MIRRAYKLATRGKDKLVSPNSVLAVEMYPENNAREGFVEYADFLELARHLPSPIDDVASFAYLMGWRREQVLSLRWADINRGLRDRNSPGRVQQDQGAQRAGDVRVCPFCDRAPMAGQDSDD